LGAAARVEAAAVEGDPLAHPDQTVPVGYANPVRIDELGEFAGEIEFTHPTGATSSVFFFSPASGDARLA